MDVVAVFDELGGEGVSQRVTTRRLANSCREHGSTDGALEDCLVKEVSAALARLPMEVMPGFTEPGRDRAAA